MTFSSATIPHSFLVTNKLASGQNKNAAVGDGTFTQIIILNCVLGHTAIGQYIMYTALDLMIDCHSQEERKILLV